MKILVISKGGRKSYPICPWMVDYPPETDRS
jgi:hypothetical protein